MKVINIRGTYLKDQLPTEWRSLPLRNMAANTYKVVVLPRSVSAIKRRVLDALALTISGPDCIRS
ncbi:MAG: hypothetical protein K0S09_2170 [Sphingobacteriaceae bacterium]|jgi:hypothetical protein|nr:hypothetical protein [Sphingobacteriaceae bacterium]